MYRLESHRLLVLSSGYALYLASCLICQCDRLHVRTVQVAPQNGQEIFHFGGLDTGLRRLLFTGLAIAVKSRSTSPKACDAWSLQATGRGFEAFTEARTVGHTQKSRGASQQRRTDPVRKLYSLPVRNHHGGHASNSITVSSPRGLCSTGLPAIHEPYRCLNMPWTWRGCCVEKPAPWLLQALHKLPRMRRPLEMWFSI